MCTVCVGERETRRHRERQRYRERQWVTEKHKESDRKRKGVKECKIKWQKKNLKEQVTNIKLKGKITFLLFWHPLLMTGGETFGKQEMSRQENETKCF